VDVLRSGRQLLANGPIDVLVETHSAKLENDCIQFLERLNYSCAIIKNAWWRIFIPELRPIAHNRWLLSAE
jgi:hypothetical protein